MTKKIIIDKEKCIGCGTCVALAPEIFEMDDNEKSKVSAKWRPSAVGQGPASSGKKSQSIDEETLKLAIDSCPTQAIKIEE